MTKQILCLLTTILTINAYAQISFEKGYFVNNSNEKTDCLIKNIDWKNNPNNFEYKLSENSESKKVNIKSATEFGIYNRSKYIRSIVKIDKSRSSINNLSYYKNPTFIEEQFFLKVLVEGQANLYRYEDSNITRFFYSKENSNIKQLVFKTFRTSNDEVAQNNEFRQQLWNDLKCQNISINDLEKIDYEEDELVNVFVKYNQCNNSEYINFEEKQKRDLFNLTPRLGLNSTSLSIQNNLYDSRDTDFGNEFGFRLGIEAEFIMPFNNNKWALIIEPSYQYFKSEKELSHEIVTIDYKSIDFSLGVRHYFFLNENSKIFVNALYILGFDMSPKIYYNQRGLLDISDSTSNFGFGIGYTNNDKYSLELRYQPSRNILRNYLAWNADYKAFSVIFGYSIF